VKTSSAETINVISVEIKTPENSPRRLRRAAEGTLSRPPELDPSTRTVRFPH
jgi:hypothetical protein